MKIKIERKSFIDALEVGSQMANKAKGLSILENIKLSVKNTMATISSYDSEIAITKRTSIVEQDEDFVVCIEPRMLLSMLRSIKDDELELSFSENSCKVIHSKGILSLPYDSADDFPTPVFDDNTDVFEVNSQTLFNWMKEARNFVSTNTLYPQLMGVYLYFENGEFGVAANDMNVLYFNREPHEAAGEKSDAVVCTKAIGALLPMINGSEVTKVMIGTRCVAFRNDNSMLVALKTEKPYPNFRSIIPANNPITVRVEKSEFFESVKRAMLTASEKTCLLKLNISEHSIKIESEDIMNAKKSYEECLATCEGGSLQIGFKGTYVIDMLNSIESEQITMLMSEERRPVLWCDMLNNNKILLQMPFSF